MLTAPRVRSSPVYGASGPAFSRHSRWSFRGRLSQCFGLEHVTKRWIRLVGTHLLHSTSSLAIQGLKMSWIALSLNRPFSLSLSLCFSWSLLQCWLLRDWWPLRNASDFWPMSISSQYSQERFEKSPRIWSNHLRWWRDARHCCTGSILTESTRSFSNLKLDEICLEIWNDDCLVNWRAILLRFGHAMLHEGHAWNSIPISNMFHVNPGLFRGSACVPDCKPSAIWQQHAWLQHYSITATGTSLKFSFMSNLQQSARPMARSFALLALPWRNLPFCRQQELQPDSHAEHHVTTLTKHLKNMLSCATSRNLQEMTTGQYHFKFTNQKNIKFIQIYQRRSKECKSLKQHASEVGNEAAFCQRSKVTAAWPILSAKRFSQLSMPTVQ